MKKLLLLVTLAPIIAVSCQSDFEPGIKGYLSVGDWVNIRMIHQSGHHLSMHVRKWDAGKKVL